MTWKEIVQQVLRDFKITIEIWSWKQILEAFEFSQCSIAKLFISKNIFGNKKQLVGKIEFSNCCTIFTRFKIISVLFSISVSFHFRIFTRAVLCSSIYAFASRNDENFEPNAIGAPSSYSTMPLYQSISTIPFYLRLLRLLRL